MDPIPTSTFLGQASAWVSSAYLGLSTRDFASACLTQIGGSLVWSELHFTPFKQFASVGLSQRLGRGSCRIRAHPRWSGWGSSWQCARTHHTRFISSHQVKLKPPLRISPFSDSETTVFAMHERHKLLQTSKHYTLGPSSNHVGKIP